MRKILINLLFLAMFSTTLSADRYTANANAYVVADYLENYGYSIRDIAGRHLGRKGYRTYNRYLYSGNCYAVVSVGDNSVRDLDIKVYNRYWDYIGADRDSDRSAVIEFCPRRSGTYRFRTIMYRGSGYFRMLIGWK